MEYRYLALSILFGVFATLVFILFYKASTEPYDLESVSSTENDNLDIDPYDDIDEDAHVIKKTNDKSWDPKKDLDYVMKGKIVDPYD